MHFKIETNIIIASKHEEDKHSNKELSLFMNYFLLVLSSTSYGNILTKNFLTSTSIINKNCTEIILFSQYFPLR